MHFLCTHMLHARLVWVMITSAAEYDIQLTPVPQPANVGERLLRRYRSQASTGSQSQGGANSARNHRRYNSAGKAPTPIVRGGPGDGSDSDSSDGCDPQPFETAAVSHVRGSCGTVLRVSARLLVGRIAHNLWSDCLLCRD